MLIKNDLGYDFHGIYFDKNNVAALNSSLLAANLKHIINMPDDITVGAKGINTPSSILSALHETVIVMPDEKPSPPSSPTPSEMLLNVYDLPRVLPDSAIQMPLDDDKDPRQDFLQRHAKNMGLTIGRNLVSVAIPTAMREYVRRAVLPALFKNTPRYLAPTIGGITAGLPVALQLFAIARDVYRGTQTAETLRARVANILLVMATGSALVASGGLSAAANALIAAVFVYVPFRDLAQYFVMLKDNNKSEFHFAPSWKSAASYAVNQLAVDQGMDILSNALTPLMGPVAANMLGRAIMNTAGETCDEFTCRGFMAQQQQNPGLKMSLNVRTTKQVSLESALDQIANTLTSRACIFSASFSTGYAMPFSGVLNSALVGATMGCGYVPFIYAHAQQSAKNQTQIARETQRMDDMEAGRLPS